MVETETALKWWWCEGSRLPRSSSLPASALAPFHALLTRVRGRTVKSGGTKVCRAHVLGKNSPPPIVLWPEGSKTMEGPLGFA